MSDVANLSVNVNLVGFGLDATEKFTKQIDTINRMNAAQDRLKYTWCIGTRAQNCQVHFVISSPLPTYLEHSKDPILTNQNTVNDNDNIIPCPYPVTTFDLLDIFAYVESMIQPTRFYASTQPASETDNSSKNDTPNTDKISELTTETNTAPLSLYERARLGLNSNVQQDEAPQVLKSEPAPPVATTQEPVSTANSDKSDFIMYNAPKKTTTDNTQKFTTYGSFNQAAVIETPTPSEATPIQSKPIEPEKKPTSSWTSTYNRNNTQADAPTDSVPATAAPQAKPDVFIRYGSLAKSTEHVDTSKTEATPIVVQDAPNTGTSTETPEPAVDTKTTILNTEPDQWVAFLQQNNGIHHTEMPELYFDANQKTIAAAVKNASELAQSLFNQPKVSSNAVTSIPNDLKKFSVSAVLWSYGLHHPDTESVLADMDLDNQEWKLKGFPKFGLWETHPTWLFLATFFAQNHHSIFAAAAKGKADTMQIKQFICASKLAGLTWDSRPLAEANKQQQLTALSQQSQQSDQSWITRLRNKLHINEHFES